ncbi:MAG: divalent-cation tolerance protein CutA [Erythrobacter sp.]
MSPKKTPRPALVWCPFPDRAAARKTASQLLTEGLIACANLIGEMESLFIWQGKQSSDQEIGVLFKTRADLLDGLIARLGVLHPYDTPAIVGWHCDAVHAETAQWLLAIGQSNVMAKE